VNEPTTNPAKVGPTPENTSNHPATSRREFLCSASLLAATMVLPASEPLLGQSQRATGSGGVNSPDYRIEIAEIEWELAPKKKIRTIAYNDQIPGKLIRLTEGKPVNIEIFNKLEHPEIVHWHGQWIAVDSDGAMEEGSPMIPPGAQTQISFTPKPSGLHWYHTHAPANRNLKRGLYSGQFGALLVDSPSDPARYDQEQFLLLHDWEPFLASSGDGSQVVQYVCSSINGRICGHDNPIKVQEGQRVLFHVVNASATEEHWLALPGHQFEIVALDGRPVATQAMVDTVRLGPAERVSAIVAMDAPGVWVLGETRADFRNTGMGTIIEYANRRGKPLWKDPAKLQWDYRAFGDSIPQSHNAEITVPLVFTSSFRGHGALDRWMINGKSFPDTDPIMLKEGLRYRLIFDNRSTDNHPVHLHRHAFELASINRAAVSGVNKDVVIVEAKTKVEVDLVANNPGATLFHCHQQDHMDSGFMTLFRYS
jgi:FtsP/CotA-like multicopper oxidase with cupredoxin domain